MLLLCHMFKTKLTKCEINLIFKAKSKIIGYFLLIKYLGQIISKYYINNLTNLGQFCFNLVPTRITPSSMVIELLLIIVGDGVNCGRPSERYTVFTLQ
jgi:hypothetical protein